LKRSRSFDNLPASEAPKWGNRADSVRVHRIASRRLRNGIATRLGETQASDRTKQSQGCERVDERLSA